LNIMTKIPQRKRIVSKMESSKGLWRSNVSYHLDTAIKSYSWFLHNSSLWITFTKVATHICLMLGLDGCVILGSMASKSITLGALGKVLASFE
jgi:hypothetical protein